MSESFEGGTPAAEGGSLAESDIAGTAAAALARMGTRPEYKRMPVNVDFSLMAVDSARLWSLPGVKPNVVFVSRTDAVAAYDIRKKLRFIDIVPLVSAALRAGEWFVASVTPFMVYPGYGSPGA